MTGEVNLALKTQIGELLLTDYYFCLSSYADIQLFMLST